MMSAILATLDLLIGKESQNKDYGVTIYVFDVIDKISLRAQSILQIWSYDQSVVTLAFL